MTRVAAWYAPRTLGLLALCAAAGSGAAPAAAAETRPRTANAAPCEACHGVQGQGAPLAAIPRLAGQSADYLAKQLDDYENHTRDNVIMRNFARGLSGSERTKLGAYYATLSAPPTPETVRPTAQQLVRGGRQLAFEGDEAVRVQACDNCHGPDGSGLPHSAPYLAGQSAEYLSNQIKAWQTGTRKNDSGEQMASIAKRLTSTDIAAVSAYFASVGTELN
jgi:cytochrome c553